MYRLLVTFFFSSRRRHTRFDCDWSSDVCSSDLLVRAGGDGVGAPVDEHPEARVAPPVHAGVALSRRFVGDVLGARWVETAGAANNQYEDADTAKRHVISSVYYHS